MVEGGVMHGRLRAEKHQHTRAVCSIFLVYTKGFIELPSKQSTTGLTAYNSSVAQLASASDCYPHYPLDCTSGG
jgi:hypothetical protein